MGLPIFLSRATPESHETERGKFQSNFLDALRAYLRSRGLEPSTVGDTHYASRGMEEVRSLIVQSNGLLTVAFKRDLVIRDSAPASARIADALWDDEGSTAITTPWCHMESAMAFQTGLPILILIEEGVRADGALEQGVLSEYPPKFSLRENHGDIDTFFMGAEMEKWHQLVWTWERHVREVVRTRGRPQSLYGIPSW